MSNCFGMRPAKLIQYAMAGYGVALSERDAQKYYDLFFEVAYPGLHGWHDRVLRDGKRLGYVESLGGRRRYLDPDVHYNEYFNTGVQASGADALKLALRLLHEALRKYGESAYTVHHVHDEIIVEHDDDPDLGKAMRHLLEECMNRALAHFLKNVPPACEAATGYSWADKA